MGSANRAAPAVVAKRRWLGLSRWRTVCRQTAFRNSVLAVLAIFAYLRESVVDAACARGTAASKIAKQKVKAAEPFKFKRSLNSLF